MADILVVDDEKDIRELVRDILEDEGFEVAIAENGAAARLVVAQNPPDLALVDIWMPDIDGISLINEWRVNGALPFPTVVMSGHGTIETAVEATRLGAFDYIEKPLSLAKLLQTVQRALQAAPEGNAAEPLLQPKVELVGRSPSMRALREQLENYAAGSQLLWLHGEEGVGKTIAARYFHQCSARASKPFTLYLPGMAAGASVAGRVPAELVQAFRSAGTVCLANPERLSLIEQRWLDEQLRTLDKENGPAVVLTSVADLAESQRRGEFVDGLYFRFNRLCVNVPPLREHCEDIHDLIGFLVDDLCAKEQLPFRRFTVAAQNRLRHHDWRGNIRELKHLLQHILLHVSADSVEVTDVERALAETEEAAGDTALAIELDQPLREAREAFERYYLEYHLQRCGGSVAQVARVAGMERTHLYRKIRQLGLEIKDIK